MNLISKVVTAALVAIPSVAQTQLVRGKVEDIPQTQNQFVLDGTNIPLVSSTLSLNQLVAQNQQLQMQVVDVGTPGQPILNVVAALPTTKMMDMGNIRLGNTDRWEVIATPGSLTAVFITPTVLTGYAPLGSWGTWLLGPTVLQMASGTVNQLGQFQFNFTMSATSTLVGTSITSQAVVIEPAGAIIVTNPDNKVIES